MTTTPEGILKYTYQPLIKEEIRLIELFPALHQDDDIQLSIEHVQFDDHGKANAKAVSRRELQKTIRKSWRVFRTPEGRTLYWSPLKGGSLAYDHPPDDARIITADDKMEATATSEECCTPFEALSYAWGNTSRTHIAFICATQSTTGTLHYTKITRSLFVAFQHLRHSSEPRMLWVDAICINQDDINEKSAQLLRVEHIFRLATRVHVWLGPRSMDSQLAVSTLEFLGQQIEISDDWSWFRSNDAQKPEYWDKAIPLPYSEEQWRALTRFFARPWFQRLWVIQEITAANRYAVMQCGQDTISWYNCRRAIAALAERVGVPEDLSEAMSKKCDIAHGLRVAALRDTIFTCRQHECSDPHDKIFSILGFLGNALRAEIIPSYRSNYEDVYRYVFLKYTKISGRLDLMQQCFLSSKQHITADLPSWVPDWRTFPPAFRHPESGYQAAGLSKAEYSVDGNTLKVAGITCGAVSLTYDQADSDHTSLITKLRELRPDRLRTDLYTTGETKLEAWVRTLVLDLLWDRFPEAGSEDLEFWVKQINHVLDCPESDPPPVLQSVSALVRDTWTTMRYFTTKDEHFDFGPAEMLTGDHVCVLLGLPTPIVARLHPSGCYQIIGWCYVHGMMDGEAVLGPLPLNWYIRYLWEDGRYTARYARAPSRVMHLDDPRLKALPREWDRTNLDHRPDDPVCVQYFYNNTTGETINYDPRMTSEHLSRRGSKLETLHFI